MPHLVRWSDELADWGLVVVAPHVQNATPEQVRAKAASLGMRFSVTASARVPGIALEGIPHCVVFDHAGAGAYEGHPSKSEGAIRTALGAALVAAAKRESFPKPVAAVADGLKKGQPPKAALAKLLPMRSSSDKDVAEAAKALAEALLGFAQTRLDDAVTAGGIDAYDTATRLAETMKGTPVGTKAGQTAVKLKSDKAVQAELKVRPTLAHLRQLDSAVEKVAAAAKIEPGSADFKKTYAAQIKQAKSLYQQMVKAAPDAKATKEAEEIAERLGAK
jgi:hypothetical protein